MSSLEETPVPSEASVKSADDPEVREKPGPPIADLQQVDGPSSKVTAGPNLGRWFWGTIIVLAVATVSLTVIAETRRKAAAERPHDAANQRVEEHVPTTLNSVLNDANSAALFEVKEQISPLLEEAYAPVYAAIPAYSDFHYSIWGSYAELGAAAAGDPAVKLQEMLFTGLGARLNEVTTELEQLFTKVFREQLAEGLANTATENAPIGPLTNAVFEDAVNQSSLSAAVWAGGVGSTKAVALAISSKIGAKIAAKAGAKAGAKWGAAATGAGGSAAICAWAGPGAAACAIGGAVAAWFATDAVVGALDELIHRDEFEAELGRLIDEDKAVRRASLKQRLEKRAEGVQRRSGLAIQNFTLRQLSGADAAKTCSTVASLVARYDHLAGDIKARNPAALLAFQGDLDENSNDLSLNMLVREIDENLEIHASRIAVAHVVVRGNLPSDLRENRKVSGILTMNGQALKFNRSSATKVEGFELKNARQVKATNLANMKIELTLEQHRLIFPNRTLGGTVEEDIFEEMVDQAGLQRKVLLTVPIGLYEQADETPKVEPFAESGEGVAVEMTLQGERMPDLEAVPDCAR